MPERTPVDARLNARSSREPSTQEELLRRLRDLDEELRKARETHSHQLRVRRDRMSQMVAVAILRSLTGYDGAS